MAEYFKTVSCDVRIVVAPEAEYAIERYVGLKEADFFLPERTRDDILEYLAISFLAYGRGDASTLDGFGDLEYGQIQMYDSNYEAD